MSMPFCSRGRYAGRGLRKYPVRVQGNDPDEIRADRGSDKGKAQYVQNCERQKSIGEETATDNKLRMARDIHQRVPFLFVRLLLPQIQELLGMAGCKPMPRRADRQETGHCSNEQEPSPNEVSFCPSTSSQSDAHSHKDEQVVQVVADSL